jgi:CBS domain containing-hemolysin-like protein
VVTVLQEARKTGHSRFPVLRDGDHRVVGIVHIKHAMGVPYERREEVPVGAAMREPVLVPSSLELDALMELLQQGGLQMAVVVDEFGDVAGVVTMEDLIEEIVGEVRDEYDPQDDRVRRLPDGSWDLSGLLRPDEAAAVTGLDLPESEEYETLGGLVALLLERVPERGDVATLRTTDQEGRPHDVELKVERMDGLRVDRVRLRATPAEPDGDEEDPS